MSNLEALLRQKKVLEDRIERHHARQKKLVIQEIHRLMKKNSLAISDLKSEVLTDTAEHSAKVRYRDPMSGSTWSGRGRMPKWLVGKSREEFEVGD